MALKVIGAGLARTGTLSLKAALEELGFGPCYHMIDFSNHFDDHIGFWNDALRRKRVDWHAFFADYQAAVDSPTRVFYEELMQLFPNAKVILTIRDPSRWYDSVRETIRPPRPFYADFLATLRAPFSTYYRQTVQYRPFTRHMWVDMFQGKFDDKQYAMQVFEQHTEDVKRIVPAARLLIFEAKQGWEPLCTFLGVPVPKGKPFPHLNERADMQQMLQESKTEKHWAMPSSEQ